MSKKQDKKHWLDIEKNRPDPGPDPYDRDEYSRSHDEMDDEIDESPQERSRREAEKYFRKGEKWEKKYD